MKAMSLMLPRRPNLISPVRGSMLFGLLIYSLLSAVLLLRCYSQCLQAIILMSTNDFHIFVCPTVVLGFVF